MYCADCGALNPESVSKQLCSPHLSISVNNPITH